jgi:hypothetical protein
VLQQRYLLLHLLQGGEICVTPTYAVETVIAAEK